MNLVGKIFTALIFVMCIVFATFALMVHAAHKNWREEIVKSGGYRQQVDKLNKDLYDQQQANRLLEGQRKNDKDRYEDQIVKLQAANRELNASKLAADSRILQLQGDLRKSDATLNLVQKTLANSRDENEALRTQIKVAVDERQKLFDNLVTKTTEAASPCQSQNRCCRRRPRRQCGNRGTRKS